jgi:hypothetical protein
MTVFKRLKTALNRFFDSLAKENEKSFGTGKLDCCQMNRQGSIGSQNGKLKQKQGGSSK